MFSYIFKSQIGPLYLQENDSSLTRLSFFNPDPPACKRNQLDEQNRLAPAAKAYAAPSALLNPSHKASRAPSALLSETASQLEAYFAGRLQRFSLPLNPQGTDFQQQVWAALVRIPYGQTLSYRNLALGLGKPKACRAVGLANNKNPIAIIIPCHRVIGSNGKLVGYAGGLEVKEALLRLEGAWL